MNAFKRFIVAVLLSVAFTTTPSYADNTYSKIYVFGDSLSDTGNIASIIGPFPNPPFFGNRVSNGLVAVEVLAAAIDLPLQPSLHLIGPAQGSNYAVAAARSAGATAIDLPTQVGLFLANHGGVSPADALYVVFIGGNDVRDARDEEDANVAATLISDAVNGHLAAVQTLVGTGARNIMVVNVPDIGGIPESGLIAAATSNPDFTRRAESLSKSYNSALRSGVKSLRKQGPAKIVLFDLFDEFAEIVEHAAENGFTNTTDACFSSETFSFHPDCGFGANFDQFIYFDEIHPTARVHEMIGREMLEQLQELAE